MREPIKAKPILRVWSFFLFLISFIALGFSFDILLSSVEIYKNQGYYPTLIMSSAGIFISTILTVWFLIATIKGRVIQWKGLK